LREKRVRPKSPGFHEYHPLFINGLALPALRVAA
jgi:hypothetical protein